MSDKALKAFLKDKFDLSSLRKAGFFPKEIKYNDYEGQSKKICEYLGLKSIYDYDKHEIRCHITYSGERLIWINKNGKIETIPFVETIFPNGMHI